MGKGYLFILNSFTLTSRLQFKQFTPHWKLPPIQHSLMTKCFVHVLSHFGRVLLFATPWTVACQSCCPWVLQARMLEWVAISFSRGSSWPRVWTCVSCVSCFASGFFYHRATGEAQVLGLGRLIMVDVLSTLPFKWKLAYPHFPPVIPRQLYAPTSSHYTLSGSGDQRWIGIWFHELLDLSLLSLGVEKLVQPETDHWGLVGPISSSVRNTEAESGLGRSIRWRHTCKKEKQLQ